MNSYCDRALREYLDDAASGKPTPGGGSVAALAGALAVSMGSMVANFTVGKKKYLEVEPEVKEILARCEEVRAKLLELTDADTRAYAKVSAAYGMPKETDEEKQSRSKAISGACREALAVPLEVARACRVTLDAARRLAGIGNRNLVSDAGVSAVLAEAALAAAVLNVEINLASLKDEAFVSACREELSPMLQEASGIREEVWLDVRRKIGAA